MCMQVCVIEKVAIHCTLYLYACHIQRAHAWQCMCIHSEGGENYDKVVIGYT